MSDSNLPKSETERPAQGLSGREAYNVVADTVTGANLRLKDNVLQAVVIAVCLVLGGIGGALIVDDRALGAIAGALIGLLVGLFGSGVFIMVYRALRHLRGRHD